MKRIRKPALLTCYCLVMAALVSGCLFQNPTPPEITTKINSVTRSEAAIEVSITSSESDIIKKGVVISTTPNPTLQDQSTIEHATGNNFQTIVPLNRGKINYARAYAVTFGGFGYGNEVIIPIVIDDSGTTWQQVELDDFYQLNNIIWDGTKFIVVGNGGKILSSQDGYEWTIHPVATSINIHAICRNTTQYIAVGGGGLILTSADGLTWIERQSGKDAQFVTVAGSPEINLAMGYQWATRQPVVFYSTDGRTWYINESLSISANKLIWANDHFIAVGAAGKIYSSSNGIGWVDVSLSTNAYNLYDVKWTGNQYLAVGNNSPLNSSIIATSIDGIVWQTTEIHGKVFFSVAYTGNIYLAVGERKPLEGLSGIYTSKDGLNWHEQNANNFYTLTSVIWSGDRYVIIGNPFWIFVSDY